jgi:hypothetical protein
MRKIGIEEISWKVARASGGEVQSTWERTAGFWRLFDSRCCIARKGRDHGAEKKAG